MTQTTLLVVSLVALFAGAFITWFAMRNSAELAADKARAEVGTKLALAQQTLQGQDSLRKGVETRLAEAQSEASQLRSQYEEISNERSRLQERAARVEVLEQGIAEAGREATSLREKIAGLHDQLGRAEGEVKAERDARQQLTSSFKAEQVARIEADNKATSLSAQIEGLGQQFAVKEQQFAEKLAFVEEAKRNLTEQFKNLANEILEDKSKRFVEQNQNNLGNLLNPLKAQLSEFKAKVETVYDQEGKDRVALQAQVKQLADLNKTISDDAKNLTAALKGNNKAQGNWGELVLQTILENSGLRLGEEFEVQASHTDENGRRLQPDVIIRMPENRSLVVDSKMSLNAYAEYISAGDDADNEAALKRHLHSIRTHIKGLSAKEYQNQYQLNTLDFVVMFIPVEPAYLLAVGQDATLYQDAWKQGVLLVSPSTLMFVLRTVEHLWRQEQQNRNAQDIAKRGAELYNKLCLFVGDIDKVGASLNAAQSSFNDAKHRLVTQKGSVIRQAELLVDLGVKPSKRLPASYSSHGNDANEDGNEKQDQQLDDVYGFMGTEDGEAGEEGSGFGIRTRRPRSESAMARARELVAEHIGTVDPREIKRMMVEQIGVSDSVANTYFSNIKKELGHNA